jgi:hypothetical protein
MVIDVRAMHIAVGERGGLVHVFIVGRLLPAPAFADGGFATARVEQSKEHETSEDA